MAESRRWTRHINIVCFAGLLVAYGLTYRRHERQMEQFGKGKAQRCGELVLRSFAQEETDIGPQIIAGKGLEGVVKNLRGTGTDLIDRVRSTYHGL